MYLLLQIRCDGGIVRSCDLTFVGAYRMFMDKGSKVIKGSLRGHFRLNSEKLEKFISAMWEIARWYHLHTCMAFDWCLLRGHRFGVKGHLRSFPAPAKMRKIGPNWPYLGLWKTDKARNCYSDATLMVGEAYNGLDPKGQSSRSKVKIYRQAPIELKVTRNNPCDILSTIQVQLTPSVTQGSSCRGQRSNFKNHRHAWIELKLDSNDPCDTLSTKKVH